MENKVYLVPHETPFPAVKFDPQLCTGCNTCVDVCRTDVLFPNTEKGKPPVIAYPDECWFCGCCVFDCPSKAIQLVHPLNQRVAWKRKGTGEFYRMGMKNPPPPNTRPPVG